MRVKELLDFVTDLTITDESVYDYLEKVGSYFTFVSRFPIFQSQEMYLMHRFKKEF